MTKQFLYIVDQLRNLNPKTDSTLAIMEEATRRGIRNFACELKDISVLDGQLKFMSAPVEVGRGYALPPVYLNEPTLRSASLFQIIFMRKDPPVDRQYLAALFMLRCEKQSKSVLVNDPDGILFANEKLFSHMIALDYVPKTLVTSNKDLIVSFADENGRIVVKPLWNSGGSGVLVFDRKDRNLSSALEILTKEFSAPVMVQSYIEAAREGDKRIIVLGGIAIGAVLRVPRDDEHRANFHAGGYAQKAVLTERDHEIVAALAPHLISLGLHFVGIDVIGGYLTEINVTSPTGIIEIERLSQTAQEQPIRAQILDYVERLIA